MNSSAESEKNLPASFSSYADCELCPLRCHVNRLAGQRGRCGMGWQLKVARASLHLWEEPCLSGDRGSGTVFFDGCPLRCVYCQNREISNCPKELAHEPISVETLVKIFLKLEALGAENINLVTATHFTPHLLEAIPEAKARGLKLPIVYNTSGYESVEALRRLDGLIDIYLPDCKYWDGATARRYSGVPDYPEVARQAIAEMMRQVGSCSFDSRGMMTRGLILRHLLLPGQEQAAYDIVRYFYETYGDRLWFSLMSQYTPFSGVADFPELNRHVDFDVYNAWVDACADLGVEQAFIQEEEAASESFIPEFDSWRAEDFLNGTMDSEKNTIQER